jgi:hypothetical protein
MKVSKRTNRICIALVIAGFIAYGFYQVVYATNDESYRFGYNFATENWGAGTPLKSDQIWGLCNDQTRGISNETACVDGIVNGWEHWCKSDTSDCVNDMLHLEFPGSISNRY